MISKEERIIQLEKASLIRMEEAASKYKDIKVLWNDYQKLKTQNHSEEFLKGYYGAISDLIIIKKML